MLPLSRPALITVSIFTFLAAWNDLIGPLVYLRTPDTYTVPPSAWRSSAAP